MSAYKPVERVCCAAGGGATGDNRARQQNPAGEDIGHHARRRARRHRPREQLRHQEPQPREETARAPSGGQGEPTGAYSS